MIFHFSVPQPFILENVLKSHGWFQLVPFYWDNENKTLKWIILLTQKAVLLRIKQKDENTSSELLFETDHQLSDRDQNNVINRFRRIFNLELDLEDFYKKCRDHPILHKTFDYGLGRLIRSESVFEDIFKSICGTNVQWKQAVKMINAIGAAGPAVPGTKYTGFPLPETILNRGEDFLKETARVGYRSRYLMALCKRFTSGESEAKRAENGDMNRDELKNYFLSFDGIGPITTNYLMALYGYYEEIGVDSFVISYMSRAHFNGRKPSAQQVQDFYADFGCWRFLAYWMEMIIMNGWNPDE